MAKTITQFRIAEYLEALSDGALQGEPTEGESPKIRWMRGYMQRRMSRKFDEFSLGGFENIKEILVLEGESGEPHFEFKTYEDPDVARLKKTLKVFREKLAFEAGSIDAQVTILRAQIAGLKGERERKVEAFQQRIRKSEYELAKRERQVARDLAHVRTAPRVTRRAKPPETAPSQPEEKKATG